MQCIENKPFRVNCVSKMFSPDENSGRASAGKHSAEIPTYRARAYDCNTRPFSGFAHQLLRLASELVRLSILERNAQHVELAGCIRLELRKSIRFVAEVFSHCREASARHQADCEDFAVPRFEPEPGAASLNFHYERISFRPHYRLAKTWVVEITRKRRKRRS